VRSRSFFKAAVHQAAGFNLVMGKNMREKAFRTGSREDIRKGMAIWVAAVLVVIALSGMTYLRNMLWRNPVTLLQDTIIKSSKKLRPHYNLASYYETRGHLDLAAETYQLVINLKPDDVMAHNNLGNVYVNQGRYGEAARELQTALSLDPKAPLSHDNLGYVYFKLGRPDEAIQEYQTAIKLAPEVADIHNNLGYVYFTQGRFDDAAEEYRRALKLKPDFPAALDNMNMLYQEMSKKSRPERPKNIY
jgi:Tfp pilus assembly protein PilF